MPRLLDAHPRAAAAKRNGAAVDVCVACCVAARSAPGGPAAGPAAAPGMIIQSLEAIVRLSKGFKTDLLIRQRPQLGATVRLLAWFAHATLAAACVVCLGGG